MKDMKFVEARGSGNNWQEEYQRKLVTAEEAVKVVKSGDRVVISFLGVPLLGEALAARKNELKNITIHSFTPAEQRAGMFFQEGMDDVFYNTVEIYSGDWVRTAPVGLDSKRTQFWPGTFSSMMKPFDERPDECPYTIDVAMTTVSLPDKDGFCSFGSTLWNKRSYCKRAKKVIVETNEKLIRTGGTNFIHVSEIDYFVTGMPDETALLDSSEKDLLIKGYLEQAQPGVRALIEEVLPLIEEEEMRMRAAERLSALTLEEAQERVTALKKRRGIIAADPVGVAIAKYVSEIVKDGDTFQIGTGFPAEELITLGAFDNKHDLGIYSEQSARGFGTLVQKGIVTGKYKTFHPGKVTVSSFFGCNREDADIIDGNPVFEQYDSEFILDIRNISQNDNFVSINNALSVDLTGQINAETGVGARLINGHGGQPELHIGAILSKGGKALTLLPSTALAGIASRIVPQLDRGAVVTVPRYYADYIITEYGIARLMGKDCRQRAEALIAIAHPNFREELKKEAKKLFYP
jgi:4-hydroxybutyrate CoA-transferase